MPRFAHNQREAYVVERKLRRTIGGNPEGENKRLVRALEMGVELRPHFNPGGFPDSWRNRRASRFVLGLSELRDEPDFVVLEGIDASIADLLQASLARELSEAVVPDGGSATGPAKDRLIVKAVH